MADFMMRFLFSNVAISGIIGILLLAGRLFGRSLSARQQYRLWLLLPILLTVPFLPFRIAGPRQVLALFVRLKNTPAPGTDAAAGFAAQAGTGGNTGWMNDFSLSAAGNAESAVGRLLFAVWIAGILAMLLFLGKSALRLRALHKSSLPLQSPAVRCLYRRCLDALDIRREIPVYSNAFLQSPVIVGLLWPRIYLPISLISDYREPELTYMLMHELLHYRHRDALGVALMNLAVTVYWFHPLVWYARKEMQTDREIACDASVLSVLGEEARAEYGSTLLNFAQKESPAPLLFGSGLGGTKRQITRRIVSIASYEKPTVRKTLKGTAAFLLTAAVLLGFAPFLPVCASEGEHDRSGARAEQVSDTDLSSCFGAYEGSFVLYDPANEVWTIHDRVRAVRRVSPNSTYKIYDALFGLEASVIAPDASQIAWDGTEYPFEAWNADQTLPSAMSASVNWYFQSLDERLGAAAIERCVKEIGYGNEDLSGGLPAYWMQGSLKISPIEQVELLQKLCDNGFGFSPENIAAVKDAIRLASSGAGTLYGKTGTGSVDGSDVNGWFVGFVETADHTFFFATNIEAGADANGSSAAEITLNILSDLGIWPNPENGQP